MHNFHYPHHSPDSFTSSTQLSPLTNPQKTILYVIREFLAQYRADLEDEYHFAPERSKEENVEPWYKECMPVQALAHVEFHLRMRRRDMSFAEGFASLKERMMAAVNSFSSISHSFTFIKQKSVVGTKGYMLRQSIY